jgi:hypothetical protein
MVPGFFTRRIGDDLQPEARLQIVERDRRHLEGLAFDRAIARIRRLRGRRRRRDRHGGAGGEQGGGQRQPEDGAARQETLRHWPAACFSRASAMACLKPASSSVEVRNGPTR